MKSKKRGSRLGALCALIAVIVSMYYFPTVLMGNAIQGQTPAMAGQWDARTYLYFETISCRSSSAVDHLLFNQSMTIHQTEDLITIYSPKIALEKEKSGRTTTTDDYVFHGGFLSQNNLYGDFSFTAVNSGGGGGTVLGRVDRFILSDDCNSANMFFTWKGNGGDICVGNGNATLERVNPSGCGYKCIENWTCSDYSECADSTQARICIDSNGCNTTNSKPSESQPCTMPAVPAPVPQKSESPLVFIVIILLILIAVAATALFLSKKMKKSDRAMVDELVSMMEDIEHAIYFGDKITALDRYRKFSEKFKEYGDRLTKENSMRIYQKGLEIYGKLVSK